MMNRVGYFNPFVPPEWIAAHGLRPEWLTLAPGSGHAHLAARRGMCPCTAALIAEMSGQAAPSVLVLTTVCDQMRYASAYLGTRSNIPMFLLNVPSTWQTAQSRALYREELRRLGRFLVQSGGREPTGDGLLAVVERYDEQRRMVASKRPQLSACQWNRALAGLRSEPDVEIAADESALPGGGIPLALVGGPLLAEDDSFLALIEEAGGRIVVDGTETGERTLPAPVDSRRLWVDPLEELVRIYFDSIPDVFRRPNTGLFDWLETQLSAHSVRGIILRRYPFSDLSHAELHRLREVCGVPLLDIDVAPGDDGQRGRIQGRIEAFLEMLR